LRPSQRLRLRAEAARVSHTSRRPVSEQRISIQDMASFACARDADQDVCSAEHRLLGADRLRRASGAPRVGMRVLHRSRFIMSRRGRSWPALNGPIKPVWVSDLRIAHLHTGTGRAVSPVFHRRRGYCDPVRRHGAAGRATSTCSCVESNQDAFDLHSDDAIFSFSALRCNRRAGQ
jgi:hypothetical protein